MKPTILALAAVLLLGSCSEARRMEKKRMKAEALIKEAIETYPGIMQPVVTTDTITLYSPAVVIKERVGYSQASMDSLATICADLLRYERERKPQVVKRLVAAACNIDTTTFSKGEVDVMVWARDGVLDLAVMKHEEAMDTVVTSSVRNITAAPCPPVKRVKSWFWVGVLVGAGALLALFGFFRFMARSHRYAP